MRAPHDVASRMAADAPSRCVAGLELLADAVLLSAVGYKYAWPANLHVLPTVHSSKRLERTTKFDLRRMQAELLHIYY